MRAQKALFEVSLGSRPLDAQRDTFCIRCLQDEDIIHCFALVSGVRRCP
jgi:hypothetical protein